MKTTKAANRIEIALLAVGCAMVLWFLLIPFGRFGGRTTHYLEWLGMVEDFAWHHSVPMALGLAGAVGWRFFHPAADRNPSPAQETSRFWLAAFVILLLPILASMVVRWREPCALLQPLLVACGIGWVSGWTGVKKYGLPVALLYFVAPPVLLLHGNLRIWSAFNNFSGVNVWQGGIGSDRAPGAGLYQLLRTIPQPLQNLFPAPEVSVFAALLIAWLIPGRWLAKTTVLFCGLVAASVVYI